MNHGELAVVYSQEDEAVTEIAAAIFDLALAWPNRVKLAGQEREATSRSRGFVLTEDLCK